MIAGRAEVSCSGLRAGAGNLAALTPAMDAVRVRACHPLCTRHSPDQELPVFPDSSALHRVVGAGAAVAGLCGAVVGTILFDGVSLGARLFFGGLFGLVLGALIGAASALTGALAAATTRLGGGRDAIGRRVAFVAVDTATALVLSWWVLLPLSSSSRLLLLVPLTAVTALAGSVIGRRYIKPGKP